MRILITNDDGIQASQLAPLVKWAQKHGEVFVAAPKYEQSGKSHGIEIHKPFEAKKVDFLPGVTAWAVDSTPADCVRFAILGLKEQFDLVISGINRGLNIGADIMYSGTVSAACEALNLGVKALAVSTQPKSYEQALEHMDRVWQFIEENDLFSLCDIYNVNISAGAGEIKITHQGGPYYSDEFMPLENDMYKPCGMDVWEDRSDDTFDTDATLHGYISIMPVTTNRTNWEVYKKLAK